MSVTLSPIAYCWATSLFATQDVPGSFCGTLGAALTFGPLFIRLKLRPLVVYFAMISMGTITGGVGTTLIQTLPNGDVSQLIAMGSALFLWQVGSSIILACSLQPRGRGKPVLPPPPPEAVTD